MLRILASDTDVATIGTRAILVEYEDPLSARSLEERTTWDEDGLLGLAQLEVEIIGLAAADVVGTLASEDEVDAETSLSNLGIDLAHGKLIILFASHEGCLQTLAYTVDVVFVNLSLDLEVREVVDLSNLLAGCDVLTQFHIEQTQFAVNGRAHFEFLLSFAHQQDVATHVGKIVLHLVHLQAAVLFVLLQAFADQLLLPFRQLVILLGLQIGLAADEFLVVEPLVLLVGTTLAFHVHTQRCSLGLVVQFVLLHRHLGVAQQVLLLGELGFGIQDLQVEVRIRETYDDITLFDRRTFLGHLLHDDAAFFGRNLHHLDRHYRTVQSHIVLELGIRHLADGQAIRLNPHRGAMVAENHPTNQCYQQDTSCDIGHMLCLQPAFLLYLSIHGNMPL